ncbi:MAG: hypothetical protein SPD11_04480 [Sphaerochaetaceae bacterium]|nr:hypothetical protein [Sphaerochaetaceae bacterium]
MDEVQRNFNLLMEIIGSEYSSQLASRKPEYLELILIAHTVCLADGRPTHRGPRIHIVLQNEQDVKNSLVQRLYG